MSFDFIDDEEPVRAPYPDHVTTADEDSGWQILAVLAFAALGVLIWGKR